MQIYTNKFLMADKEFLEQMLSMLPEEFQDIYDDTIPEAKKIRKKMRDKNYKSMHLCCYVEKTDEVKECGYFSLLVWRLPFLRIEYRWN